MARVITYASRSLRPGERSMRDYSSAKIELLALKWCVCEKFKDYLLGSKFMVYTDNNLLVYIKTSKLGRHKSVGSVNWPYMILTSCTVPAKVTWLLMQFHGGRNHLPVTPEGGEDDSNEEWEAISYPVTNTGKFYGDHNTISSQVIFQELTEDIGGVKISHNLKERTELVGTAYEDMGEGELPSIQLNVVELFSHITPEQMAEFQGSDNQIGPILQWVKDSKFPSKSILYRVKSKATRKLFYQLDRLVLKQGYFIVCILTRTWSIISWSYHKGYKGGYSDQFTTTWVTKV